MKRGSLLGATARVLVVAVFVCSLLVAMPVFAATTVGGRVTDFYTGENVAGVNVYLEVEDADWGWLWSGWASTDENGLYTFTSVQPGTYRVQFESADALYAEQWWNDKASAPAADMLLVTGTSPLTGVNAALRPTQARIRGVVRDAGNNAPLEGVDVAVYEYNGASWEESYDYRGYTGADGAYEIWLPAGTYRLSYSVDGYAVQYWQNQASVGAATSLAVSIGAPAVCNVSLRSIHGTLTGKVTEAQTGMALSGVTVKAKKSGSYDDPVETMTSAGGTYLLSDLEAGDYTVSFSKSGYRPEYYDDEQSSSEATKVAVSGGSTTGGIDAALTPAAIVGRVTNSGGTGLSSGWVSVYTYSTQMGRWRAVGGTWLESDSNGNYEIYDLPDGSYRIRFTADGLAGEYYDGKTSVDTADPVLVTNGKASSAVNASLGPVSDDKVAPQLSSNAKATYSGHPGFITLSASDVGSGVKSLSYSIDGAAAVTSTYSGWTAYDCSARVEVFSNGTHSVEFWASDNAGNETAKKTVSFTVDATPVPGSWESKRTGYYWDVDAVDGSHAFAFGSPGLAVTSDGGSTWVMRSAPSGAGCIDFVSPSMGWCGADGGKIYKTTDGGQNWSAQSSGTTIEIDDICFVDSQHGWASGSSDFAWAILGTTDGGSTWKVQKTGSPGYLQALDFADTKHGVCGGGSFAAGLRGMIFTTHDGGVTWTETILPESTKLQGACMVDATHGWIGGYEDSLMFKTTDGSTWQRVTNNGHPDGYGPDVNGFAFTDRDHGWVATGSYLYYTADAGAHWGAMRLDGYGLWDVCFTGTNDGWAVGRGGIYKYSSKNAALLSLSAPSVSSYASAKLSGYLKDASGKALGGKKVSIEYSSSGTWKPVGYDYTDSAGYYSYTAKPTRMTSYRAVFAGDSSSAQAISVSKTVLPQVFFSSAPKFSTYTHTYGKTYTVSGYFKPKHSSGSTQIKVQAYKRYKRSDGTYGYALKKTFSTKVSNPSGSSYSKYKGSVKLPSRGKWRLRAYHAADSTNAKTYSAYRYVTVK